MNYLIFFVYIWVILQVIIHVKSQDDFRVRQGFMSSLYGGFGRLGLRAPRRKKHVDDDDDEDEYYPKRRPRYRGRGGSCNCAKEERPHRYDDDEEEEIEEYPESRPHPGRRLRAFGSNIRERFLSPRRPRYAYPDEEEQSEDYDEAEERSDNFYNIQYVDDPLERTMPRAMRPSMIHHVKRRGLQGNYRSNWGFLSHMNLKKLYSPSNWHSDGHFCVPKAHNFIESINWHKINRTFGPSGPLYRLITLIFRH